MKYFKITYDSLAEIRRRLEKFKFDCEWEIDKQIRDGIRAQKEERDRDLSEGNYSETSIYDYYNKEVKELEDWGKNLKNKIANHCYKCFNVINDLETKRFTETDYGWRYILDFHEGELRREVQYENRDAVYIRSEDLIWEIDGVDIHLDTESPKFGDWQED